MSSEKRCRSIAKGLRNRNASASLCRVELIVDLAARANEVLDSEDIEEANAWLAGRVRAIWCEGREVVGVELI